MPRFVVYTILLFGVCAYAYWRGRSDERITATVCIAASLASLAMLGPVRLRYSDVEIGVLTIDVLALGAFVYVALRSDRFWPLWISGLQLTTSVGHFLKAVELSLLPQAYAAALRMWSYPILIILAVATWRSHRRAQMEQQAALA